MRRATLLSCLTAAAVALFAVPAWAAEIVISDDGLTPERVQVEPGETIVWTNATDGTVTLRGDEPGWDSGPLTPGETFSVALEAPGTYRYTAGDDTTAGEIVVAAAGGDGDPGDR
ncbi:MAG: cupredoxin domain-containing protein, partial [Actinomycetota bacterium]|nr:cupredoxin domain-containing protein [Actinomycetota bacterium]